MDSKEQECKQGHQGRAGNPESLQKYGFLEMKLTHAFHFTYASSSPRGSQRGLRIYRLPSSDNSRSKSVSLHAC